MQMGCSFKVGVFRPICCSESSVADGCDVCCKKSIARVLSLHPVGVYGLKVEVVKEEFVACAALSKKMEFLIPEQITQFWERACLFEQDMEVFHALLQKFITIPGTVSHLITVHNEACGCQVGSVHESSNHVWNQKKLAFLELQKLSGLDFDDYLNRALRLLIMQDITLIEPISESDFWLQLRTLNNSGARGNIEEDLKDIHMIIAKDIGADANNLIAGSGGVMNSELKKNEAVHHDNNDDLTKLKRQEKHMAPIDCTGVAPAFNMRWNCRPCNNRQHTSKYECETYKHLHFPQHEIKNSAARNELPSALAKRDGIYTTTPLKAFTKLGPLKGRLCNESDVDFDEDRSDIWLLYREDGTRKCLLTDDPNTSNWVRHVSPASSANEANVLAVSIHNELFLVTHSDVPADTELKYFAKEDPTTEFWTSWTQAWANQTKCSRCSIYGRFKSVGDYRVHISLWHDMSFHGNPQNRIYYCPDCSEQRIGAKEITQHCRDVHDSLPFRCRHCPRRFETYNSLMKHKSRIHMKNKPLKKACDTCGKVYLDPKALKQHIRQVHEKSEQLSCVQCDFIFSSKYALNRHVKEVHHRQQEHACPKCGKQFTQFSNLKQHLLIHIGAKPFICAHKNCSSPFTTKQCLQVHYKKVHNYTADTMPPIHKKPVGNFNLIEAASGSRNSFEVPSASSSSSTYIEQPDFGQGEVFNDNNMYPNACAANSFAKN